MPGILTGFRPAAVTAAIEENLFAFLTATGGWPRMEVHDEPDLLWTLTDVPFPSLNVICRARLRKDRVEAAIEAAAERCRVRGVPALWIVGPSTAPPDLGTALAGHGFVPEEYAAGLAADLAGLPDDVAPAPPGLTIELVAGDAAMDIWSGTCAAVGDLPDDIAAAFAELGRHAGYAGPHFHYLAYLDGNPVSTLTLFLSGRAAGFYDGGTVPEARRQGIFECLMRRAMQDGRARGYRLGVLHASEMSLNVCHRLGFRQYCTIDQYVWEG